MTVTRAAITGSLVRDVRAARVRRRVCQAADQVGRKRPKRPVSRPMTRAVTGRGRTVTRVGTRQHRAIGAALPVGSFELQ
jgi:hypothetical protein